MLLATFTIKKKKKQKKYIYYKNKSIGMNESLLILINLQSMKFMHKRKIIIHRYILRIKYKTNIEKIEISVNYIKRETFDVD